jgi:hypothetical protein
MFPFFKALNNISLSLLRIKSGDYRYHIRQAGFRESYTLGRDLEYLRESLSLSEKEVQSNSSKPNYNPREKEPSSIGNAPINGLNIHSQESSILKYQLGSNAKLKLKSIIKNENQAPRVWHSYASYEKGAIVVSVYLEGNENINPAIFGVLSATFFSHAIGSKQFHVKTYFTHLNAIISELNIFSGAIHISVCVIDPTEKKLQFYNVGSICNFIFSKEFGAKRILDNSQPMSSKLPYKIYTKILNYQDKLNMQLLLFSGELQARFVKNKISNDDVVRLFQPILTQRNIQLDQKIDLMHKIFSGLAKSEKEREMSLVAIDL